MKSIFLMIVLFCLSHSNLVAENFNDKLLDKFIKNELSEEEAKHFAIQAATQFELVTERIGVLKYSNDHNYSKVQVENAVIAIKDADSFTPDSTKLKSWGMLLSWYLVSEGDKLSTLPLVREIDQESAAYKAGIRNGDVITKVKGCSIQSTNSVIIFRRLLSLWPNKAQMQIEIIRSPQNTGKAFSKAAKNKHLTLVIEP